MRRSWLRLFLTGVVIAGAIAGYLASTGLGERLVHQEIETQLSRILSGPVEIDEVELRFVDGFHVEARGVEAYPSADPSGQPALRANRVLASIDLLALLIGRLELSTLVLDGPHLRIEQRADGSFVQLPLPDVDPTTDSERPVSMGESVARRLESMAPSAAAFINRFRVADRIEVLDGTVHWIDRGRLTEAGTPREIRLELLTGTAERNWLSGSISVDSRAVFVDGEHAPFPIEFELRSDESPHFEWTASFSQVPMKVAEAPLAFVERLKGIDGSFDGRVHFSTSGTDQHSLELEGAIENGTVSVRHSDSIIELSRIELRAELVLDDKLLRITEGHLNGERLGFDFKGAIERPIRPTSDTHFESRLIGARLKGIRYVASRLDQDSDLAAAILLFTERIEAGHLRYIRAAGTAPLQHWQNLATGRTRDLPDEFRFGAAVEKVTLGTGSTNPIELLEGEIEWVEDSISLRNMNAIYNGTRLPELSAEIEGVSHLIRATESARTITKDPPPIPGVNPLIEIFKPLDPNSPPPIKAVGLAIDRLDHPLLRWPIRDMRVLIEPQHGGMDLNIRNGVWGGAAVEGNLVWRTNSTSENVRAHLMLGPPPAPTTDSTGDDASEESFPQTAGPTLSTEHWASGRFEVDFRPRPRIPFQRATGFFRLDGSNLVGSDVEVELAGSGQAALRTKIGLTDPESIDLDLSFAITEATFDGMGEFVLIPTKLVSGDVGATGSLKGLVRPNTSFIAELDGRVRVEADSGVIQTSVPLLFRLGKASEGYNPFAHEDELDYESMTGTVEIEHGQLTVNDFEIEGPLRVFANAELDTNRSGGYIRAVVGIFLFRTSGEILDNLPLIRSLLPGSDRGLIGAYFEVEGPLDSPEVDSLPVKTMLTSVPDAIKAPFKALRFLFGRGKDDS